jgi:RNA-directed DNA polymerase
VAQFLEQIARDLQTQRYRPSPARRVYLPKPDGRQRPIGIPNVRDRVIQQACKIVIEPIFEANFLDSSYGFRPRRSAQQAVLAVKEALIRGWHVVEADIQSFFDTMDHDLLMSLLKRRISDRRVLKLIGRWLKAGVLEDGLQRATEVGSPQGGVISPLLANVYLHGLDMLWAQNHASLGQLYRYADDFIIVCRTRQDAQRALQAIKGIMARLKLSLHPTKTRSVDMGREGFDFLGFHFHKLTNRRTHKLLPYLWPAPKAMQAIRNKLRDYTTRKRLSNPLTEVVKFLHRAIRGWRNYFQIGHSTRQLQQLDRYVSFRLRRWLRSRQGSRGHWNERACEALIANSGLEYFYASGRRGAKP